jgi:hypothetical protein
VTERPAGKLVRIFREKAAAGGQAMRKIEPDGRLAMAARLASSLVIVLTIAVLVSFAIRAIYYEVAICVVSLAIFVYVQFFLSRRWLRNPPAMQLFIAAVFFVGLTVGRYFYLYRDAPGFDKFVHLLYGAAFGVIGYAFFYRLNPSQKERLTVTPATLFVLAVCFASICSFFWEIYEFSFDRLFGSNMQHWRDGLVSGLNDTMLDMVADLLGAALVSAVWLRLQRRDPGAFYKRRIAPFLPLQAAGPGSQSHMNKPTHP